MDFIKHFFFILLKLLWGLASMVIAVLLIFFGTLYFTDSKIASDLAESCISCKKPGVEITGPRDIDGDGKLTAKDWGIYISPTTTLPKVAPDLNPTDQQSVALGRVNYYRKIVGIKPLTLNKRINKAAESHARYNADKSVAGHVEEQDEAGFSGAWPWDRMSYFGYRNYTYATEVCSAQWASSNYPLRVNPVWAVDGWMSTVYHRLPLINPNVYEAGFGISKSGNRITYVMDYANPGFKDSKRIICYPVDKQDGVPLEFSGDESPDPLPGKTYPVGYPVSITFNGYKHIEIKEVVLIGANGTDVDFYRLLPFSDEYIKESLVIVPKLPLIEGTLYKVKVRAVADGEHINLRWSFKTK